MKAGIYFTGTGPILMLTSYESLTDAPVVNKLNEKGIRKFIAYEVPIDEVKNLYGNHYYVVLEDLKQDDALRVVDEDGQHVLNNFSVKSFGKPVIWES